MTLRILLILGALSAIGPLAVDLYLPAFPALAEAFATDVGQVQRSLAAYFVGLAFGQLLYGPLVDRFGRRWPLLLGIGLFCLASLACALATTLEALIAARFVQALGGCAGMVAARTVVRDLCDPATSARVFSRLMLVMGLAPILAPLLGGLLLVRFGWSSLFVVLFAFSAGCALAVALWLHETYPAGLPRAPMSGALRQYRQLAADPAYLGYALTSGFGMAGMFAYIAGSPFVFIQLYGVPSEHYGWLFGTNAAGFILMSQINARLLRRRGAAFWLRRWVAVYFACAVALVAVAAWQPPWLWPLLVPLFGCIASLGAIMPNATACAMAGQADKAGSASALLGSLQFGSAALAASLVGALHDGSARPLAGVIGVCGVLTLATSVWTVRRQPAAVHG